MKERNVILVVLLIMLGHFGYGQDPQFSQFFSSPLNINPSLTAHINSDWRLISNLRDQWIGPASPYATGTISYDRKIFQNKVPNVEPSDDNVFGIGGMFMYDYAMSGIQKSLYASLNLSYSIKFAETYYTRHRFGVGFGTSYGRRYIDFSRLYFQDQWIGYNGFNTNLPTGEAALSNMKPYLSLSAGALYNIYTDKSNFDVGVAAFHVNKPKQTFLEDENQVLAMRKVAHANYERFINEGVVLNANAIYQYQSNAHYFSVGGGLGYLLPDQPGVMLNLGVWYWSDNAVVPYAGLTYKDLQVGLSYDATISKLRQATRKPNTFELSIILRGITKPTGVIPCPWR